MDYPLDPKTDIQEHEWEFYGAVALPLYCSIYPPLYTHGFTKQYGSPLSVLISFEKRLCHWLMRADQLQILAEKFLPQFMEMQWKYYEQWMQELVPFEQVNQRLRGTDLSALEEGELYKRMREYRESFGVPLVTNNIVEPLSFYFLHNIGRLLLEEGVDEVQAAHLMDIYGQAARPSYTKECAEEYRHASDDQAVRAVLEKYYYINNDYGGVHPATKEDLEQLVKTSPYAVASAQKTKGISSKAQALLNVMQISATIQDVRKEHFLKMVGAAGDFGRDFSRRSGIAYENIEYVTWAELESGNFDTEDLPARRQHSVMYWTLEGDVIFSGNDAEQIMKEISTHVLKVNVGVKEVKGYCASKGRVSGRAVVVMHLEEFDRVRPGDILITMMTRPEFLPIMHRAAAFVCDEGGITSHAAIVAREMKKPCVIGTRTGTRIFKDGDMVEVDADRGIVRIIE